MEENIASFSPFKPCSEEELAALEKAAVAYKSGGLVGCTSCNYCMPCPYGLDIPGLMKFRNDYLAKDSRVEKVMLPLRDGLTIIRKK